MPSLLSRLSDRFVDSRLYTLVFGLKVKHLTRVALGVGPETTDQHYQSYIQTQIARSAYVARKRTQGPPKDRTVQLVAFMRPFVKATFGRPSILCVGCRDARELDHIEHACNAEAVGIDLFSVDPRIRVGDMHRLPFADARFDGVYSCHSLEHAYDLGVALAEFVRVTKPGGVLTIEVPVEFNLDEVAGDRHDIGSTARLVQLLGDAVEEVLAQEESTRLVSGVTKREARVVIRLASPHSRAISGIR